MALNLPVMSDADLAAFDQLHTAADSLRQQIHRVVVGQDAAVDLLVTATLCGGHTLLVGVPGLAKTMLVRTLAGALGWQFRRIQFTPDMMPSDVVGTELIQVDTETGRRAMRFEPGPIFANLVLADEINRTPPRTQAALLEAMAERQVTAAGRTMALEDPFVVVATQNPIEQEGTYPLPEAQLDRFMFSVTIDYPPAEQERQIVGEIAPDFRESVAIEPMMSPAQAVQAAGLIRRMPLAEHVRDYAVDLVRSTRPESDAAPDMVKRYIAWGAGPRAGQYLVLAAKAHAALGGEPTPNTHHVRAVAPAVLTHRLVTNYAATGDGVSAAEVVESLIH